MERRVKLIKFFSWLTLAMLAVPTGIYLFFLIINWNDLPPSSAAIEFQRALDSRPKVSDSENAFVYVSGFFVEKNLDPRKWGRKRIDWIDSAANHPGEGAYDNPPGEYISFAEQRSSHVKVVSTACSLQDAECFSALENAEETLNDWLKEETWLLNRYLVLIDHPIWQEIIPPDIAAPFPLYSEVLEGQKLLFIQAWKLAQDGNTADVNRLLQSDILFWRMVLANSDILITKMIATAAINRHFAWSNLILKRLPVGAAAGAIPDSWRVPFSGPEISMGRCLIGEWKYAINLVEQLKVEGMNPLLIYTDSMSPDESDWWDETLWRYLWPLFKPMLQVQDTSNRHAEMLLQVRKSLSTSIEEYPQAIQRAREIARSSVETPGGAFNVIGNALFNSSYVDYGSYSARVVDLEGVRRAALLTAELRSRNLEPVARQIRGALEQSKLRHPYTAESFTWNEETGAIEFVGLASGERGKHFFLY